MIQPAIQLMEPKHLPRCPADLSFSLPEGAVALHPASTRGAARLLISRLQGPVEHGRFAQFEELLQPGDRLVLNDVRVGPARIDGRKASGGRVELLVLPPWEGSSAVALLRSNGRVRSGTVLSLGVPPQEAELGESVSPGTWCVELKGGVWSELLESSGLPPLPPYIERKRQREELDRSRYQTVYAHGGVAVAAPTAGLHFDTELLSRLEAKGVKVLHLCLEIGPGTFRPLDPAVSFEHQDLEGERYWLPQSTAKELLCPGPIVAVGTTVVRALEGWYEAGCPRDGAPRTTHAFLYPGCQPKGSYKALLTNLHLPESSLIALVACLADTERVRGAYAQAMEEGYGFYSFGDASYFELGR